MSDNRKTPMKSISKLISQSSQNFFAAFLDDSRDRHIKNKERLDLIQKLQVASAQKSLVVLQIKETTTTSKFETVLGWVVSKDISESIMLKLQEDPQQIRMITTDHIRKVSTVVTSDNRQIR